MNNKPRAFLSYSHEDRSLADRVAGALVKQGVETWYDRWELFPGDSLVDRIFEEGLAGADVFLILLSKSSTTSQWVREELNAATIKRISGKTRIIPLLKEQCNIPESLKSLVRVDLSADFDLGMKSVIETIHGVHDRPEVGPVPPYIAMLRDSIGGLSKLASAVGRQLVEMGVDEDGRLYSDKDIQEELPNLGFEQVRDAFSELEEFGLVAVSEYTSRILVTPTYALFIHFKDDGLPYDPGKDLRIVACAVASTREIHGEDLQRSTNLVPPRINRAVQYLEDYGVVTVTRYLGTQPYDFGWVMPTWKTRQWADEFDEGDSL